MTSDEFAYKVLRLAEKTIERIDETRVDVVVHTEVSLASDYIKGYEEGLSAAKDVIINLETLFDNITTAESAAELSKRLMEGVKENA